MRSFVWTLLLSPLLRQTVVHARKIPSIEYPVCRRNFTCSTTSQYFTTIMSDLNAEAKSEVERLAKPASDEAEILAGNAAREEVVTEAKQAAPEKDCKGEKKEEQKKLSVADFTVYNSMAEHMEYFHNHFRQSWTLLYNACTSGKRPASLTLKQFLNTGLQFCSHLTTHHAIEEQHIFPVLATKMPEFKAGRNRAELLRQHDEIHHGMDALTDYLQQCISGEMELDLKVLKTKMDSWGEVLWTHLDQEVKTLGAENMRKYWSLNEMRRMPM